MSDKSANTGIVQTTPSPDFHIPETPQGTGIVGAVLTVIGGILWVRRKVSKDSVENAKDKTEKDLLATITAERDRAVKAAEEAWKTRAEDAKLIGQLTAEVKHLTIANESLVSSVQLLRTEVHKLRNDMQLHTSREELARPAPKTPKEKP